jgi:hypothetical protein
MSFNRLPRASSILLALGVLVPTSSHATDEVVSFFVTSVGLGSGANLGGLDGADRYCQALAAKAGHPSTSWRAYLSTQTELSQQSVNARDRIGLGPWYNSRGSLIANSLEDLHGPGNRLSKSTALTESGEPVPGKLHDILTGTRIDGTAPSPLDPDMTCKNWTSDADGSSALVGHHDRVSAINQEWAKSWNSAHLTRGCSAQRLAELGSGGLFYCFRLSTK